MENTVVSVFHIETKGIKMPTPWVIFKGRLVCYDCLNSPCRCDERHKMSVEISKVEFTHTCPKEYTGVHGILTLRTGKIHYTLTGMQIECPTNHCPACGELLRTDYTLQELNSN